MKYHPQNAKSIRAFTLSELLVTLGVIALLALFIAPGLSNWKARSQRVRCSENLKEFGLEFRTQNMEDNAVWKSAALGNIPGKQSLITAAKLINASSLTNARPEQWICPTDTRKPAANGAPLRDENLSYFVGLAAQQINPSSLLAGDRNLALDGVALGPGVADLSKGTPSFTSSMHNNSGNVAFGDGSIQGVSNTRLGSFKPGNLVVLP